MLRNCNSVMPNNRVGAVSYNQLTSYHRCRISSYDKPGKQKKENESVWLNSLIFWFVVGQFTDFFTCNQTVRRRLESLLSSSLPAERLMLRETFGCSSEIMSKLLSATPTIQWVAIIRGALRCCRLVIWLAASIYGVWQPIELMPDLVIRHIITLDRKSVV